MRTRARGPAGMNVRALTATGLGEAWRSAPFIAIGIGLIALGLLFRVEVIAAVGVWEASTAYNHCFLVIPIVLFLIWDRRDTLQNAVAQPYPLAILAGVPLAVAWFLAERIGIMEGRQLVAMTFVELLFFVVLGPRLWWRLAGPLLYLYFLVPFGAFLTPKLQDITTVFVTYGLPILGIPAFITGYTIEIPEGNFLIAEACAGLRFLIAAIAFGCLYALLMYRSPLRRTVFIVVSIIVPIVANGFRALGIVALGHYMGSAEAVEADHVLYGWIFFSIVILLLILLGLPFRQDQIARAAPATESPPPAGNHLRLALLGTVAVVLLAGIGPVAAMQLDRFASPNMAAELPSLTPASGCSLVPAPLTTGLDAPGRMLIRQFDCGDGPVTVTIEVFSPRSTSSRMFAEQRRLIPGIGSEDAESRVLPVPAAPPGTWRLISDPDAASASATSMWIDGKAAQYGLAVRMLQGWRSIFGGGTQPVLVVVSADGSFLLSPSAGRQQASARVAGFLQAHPSLNELLARLSGTAG